LATFYPVFAVYCPGAAIIFCFFSVKSTNDGIFYTNLDVANCDVVAFFADFGVLSTYFGAFYCGSIAFKASFVDSNTKPGFCDLFAVPGIKSVNTPKNMNRLLKPLKNFKVER
jgi:hypothetical protein